MSLSEQFFLLLNANVSVDTLKHGTGGNLCQFSRLHFMKPSAVHAPF